MLLKRLNTGDYEAVPGDLMRWVDAGGKRFKGLSTDARRKQSLWSKGEFVSINFVPAAPKPSVDSG